MSLLPRWQISHSFLLPTVSVRVDLFHGKKVGILSSLSLAVPDVNVLDLQHNLNPQHYNFLC